MWSDLCTARDISGRDGPGCWELFFSIDQKFQLHGQSSPSCGFWVRGLGTAENNALPFPPSRRQMRTSGGRLLGSAVWVLSGSRLA